MNGHALSQGYYDALCRACTEGRIQFQNIRCVTPDTKAPLALAHPQNHIAKTLGDFLRTTWEESNAQLNTAGTEDLLIPDHTAPHVMMQALIDWARQRHPSIDVYPESIPSAPPTPFLKDSPDHSVRAMSYATWICPLECDEPKICPHTHSTRDWDFNESLGKYLAGLQDQGEKTYRFFSRQLVDAVSYISMKDILSALADWELFLQSTLNGFANIATHSHCHGILGRIAVQH